MKDLVIIGQGPAGISAALYAVRGGAPVAVVAKDGGALAKTELIQNYYGFENGISGKELLARGVRQAENLGVRFVRGELFGVEFGADGFEVKTSEGTLHAGANSKGDQKRRSIESGNKDPIRISEVPEKEVQTTEDRKVQSKASS